MRSARAGVIIAVTAALVLTPAAAYAHGIGDVSGRSVAGFIPLGIEHMLLGWDHLLFIAGVLLVAKGWRQAAKLISLFALGHSITLIIATLAGWQINPTLVDVLIGLSVVYVGVVALRGAHPDRRIFAAVVFAFGLVHGLGLSTRLQAVGLPEGGVLPRVIAFNVGIEIGQLIAIAVILGLVAAARWLWRTRDMRQSRPVQVTSAALVAGGVLASALVAYSAFTGTPATEADVDEEAVAVAEGDEVLGPPATGCSEGPITQLFGGGGGHTEKSFYEPTEAIPMADVGHQLADGYLAYLYRPDLPADQVDLLRAAVQANGGIIAGPVPDQTDALQAVTAWGALYCPTFDEQALADFTSDWSEGLG